MVLLLVDNGGVTSQVLEGLHALDPRSVGGRGGLAKKTVVLAAFTLVQQLMLVLRHHWLFGFLRELIMVMVVALLADLVGEHFGQHDGRLRSALHNVAVAAHAPKASLAMATACGRQRVEKCVWVAAALEEEAVIRGGGPTSADHHPSILL